MAKRLFDLVLAVFGLMLTLPLLLVIAIAVKLTSSGPVLFRHERVGRHGVPFNVFKFRTMITDADKIGPSITASGDARVTKVGRLLRATKLDELPQLFNVVLGHMSLVGPRPEVQRYIDLYSNEQREVVLSVRPGITDNASIEFRDESDILAAASNAEACYIEEILPRKIQLYMDYVASQSLMGDVSILLRTLAAVVK